jgi:DNA-binding XRE family transcriptional regulator
VKNNEEIKFFGTHLRKVREERNLSQQSLADMADVAKITIQRIENAKYAVTLDVLISISKALDLTLEELLRFSKKEE